MSVDERALLLAFCEWCRQEGIEFRHRDEDGTDEGRVEVFLSSRRSETWPDPPIARNDAGKCSEPTPPLSVLPSHDSPFVSALTDETKRDAGYVHVEGVENEPVVWDAERLSDAPEQQTNAEPPAPARECTELETARKCITAIAAFHALPDELKNWAEVPGLDIGVLPTLLAGLEALERQQRIRKLLETWRLQHLNLEVSESLAQLQECIQQLLSALISVLAITARTA